MKEPTTDPKDAGAEGATRKERKARGLLIASSLGLFVAVAAVGLGVRIVLAPGPERCPLPALRVSKPIADFTWSPDGKRLMAAATNGEVWLVNFPEVRAERLPPFPQIA
jgi:hypothetical protein